MLREIAFSSVELVVGVRCIVGEMSFQDENQIGSEYIASTCIIIHNSKKLVAPSESSTTTQTTIIKKSITKKSNKNKNTTPKAIKKERTTNFKNKAAKTTKKRVIKKRLTKNKVQPSSKQYLPLNLDYQSETDVEYVPLPSPEVVVVSDEETAEELLDLMLCGKKK